MVLLFKYIVKNPQGYIYCKRLVKGREYNRWGKNEKLRRGAKGRKEKRRKKKKKKKGEERREKDKKRREKTKKGEKGETRKEGKD